jgi:hypothetical protein
LVEQEGIRSDDLFATGRVGRHVGCVQGCSLLTVAGCC